MFPLRPEVYFQTALKWIISQGVAALWKKYVCLFVCFSLYLSWTVSDIEDYWRYYRKTPVLLSYTDGAGMKYMPIAHKENAKN